MQLTEGTKGAPAGADLAHIETWIFDLDNTLYPSNSRLFDQVDQRIGAFIANLFDVDRVEARRLQKSYFREYGTTLRGLMLKHDMAPAPFLEYVHDIDLSPIARSDILEAALGRLPGRKLVFTNADAPYAERVLARLGIDHHFSGIYDIAAADWVPKPSPFAYERLTAQHAVDPARAILFEDILRNLAPAAALGMATVWVRNDSDWASTGAEQITPDYVTDDLAAWLAALPPAPAPAPGADGSGGRAGENGRGQ